MSDASVIEWIPLNRKDSATTATTALYKTLSALGADIVNLGQGAEIASFPLLRQKVSQAFIDAEDIITATYNKKAASFPQACAEWMHRILGIGTDKATTFAVQSLGRVGLDQGLWVMARGAEFPRSGKYLIPDMSWPMVGDLLQDYNLGAVSYRMERKRYAANIREQLERYGDQIVGLYINSPHNPTGQILTAQDFKEIFEVLDEWNSGEKLAARGGRKIGIIMDAPYVHACRQTDRRGCVGLDTGLEPFTQTTVTPWIIPVSGSKFFGTANIGFTMIAAHPLYAEKLGPRLVRTVGMSFLQPFLVSLGKVMAPENDAGVLKHFGGLAKKYGMNRGTLEAAFPDRVVDGDSGMTAVIRIDANDFMGRAFTKPDGTVLKIETLDDVVEYLANAHGVATVNNGGSPAEGYYLRVAAAAKPKDYAKGISRLKTGLEAIRAMPVCGVGCDPAVSGRRAFPRVLTVEAGMR